MEPDLIDKKLKDPNSILKLEVMKFLSPVTACINQIWFQLTMLAFGVWLLVDASKASSKFSVYGLSRYRELKLEMTIQGQSSSDFFATYPSMSGELHLLRAGCSVASEMFTIQSNSNLPPLISTRFSYPLEIDGFSLKLSKTNISSDVRFVVYGSPGPDENWIRFGQTTELRKLCGEIRFSDLNDYKLLSTGQTVCDLRAPWPLFAESSMSFFLLSCSCLSMAVMGFRKNHHDAKTILIITTVVLALVALIAGGGYCFLGMWRESFAPFLDALIYLLLFISIRTTEKWFFDAIVALSIIGLIGAFIQDCILFHDCSHFSSSPPIKYISFAALGSTFLVLRRLSLLQAVQAVSADTARLNALWREVQSSCEEAQALHALADVASQLASELSSDPAHARQYNRRRRPSALTPTVADTAPPSPAIPAAGPPGDSGPAPAEPADDAGRARDRADQAESGGDDSAVDSHSSTLSGTSDPARPVLSLDQLYAQALGASTALLAHSAAWAAGAGGVLDVEPPCDEPGPPAPGSAGRGLLPPSAAELIRRRAMKAPARAVEKALTCYAGDVSRVVDVCRCRVLFASAAGVARCLELVRAAAAGGVRVVRVKNGMDVRSNAWSTAGFRVRGAGSDA